MTDVPREALPVQPPRPALNTSIKIAYGVGNIGLIMKATLFGTFTLYLYTTVMGLPSAWVGIASAVCLLWDAFIDPYIGNLSDRATWRFGRRHTPMLVGGLIMGISFWAYMAPPQGWPVTWVLAWLVGASLLVRTSMSLFGVPYLALGAELSDDYHERTSITGIRGILSLVGSMTAVTLSFMLFFPETTPGVDPKLNYDGYVAMGFTFGLCMTVCALVATWGTLSWRPYLRRCVPAAVPARGNMVSRFRTVMKNRSFFLLVCSTTLFFVAIVLNRSVYLYYLTHRVEITDSTWLSLFEGAGFLGGVLGVVLGLRVARRVEKVTLYNVGTLTTAGFMAAAHFLIGEGRLLGAGNGPLILCGAFLTGICGSVVLFIPHSMLADVVDEDELRTGHRREGGFFGVFSLCQQSATGIALALGGILLQVFVGLVAGEVEQTQVTIDRIGVIFGLVPAILLVIAGLCTLRYGLTRRRVGDIQQALLAQRRGR